MYIQKLTKKQWIIIIVVLVIILSLGGYGIYKVAVRHDDGWSTNKEGETVYYLDNHLLTGWQELYGEKYFFNEDGILQKGFVTIEDKTYYFDKADGEMKTGWQTISSKKYYFDEEGAMATGFTKIGEDTYCFGDGGAMILGEKEIDGVTYNFGEDGKLQLKEDEASVEIKEDEQGNTVVEIKKNDGSVVENKVSASSSIYQAPAESKVETVPTKPNTSGTTNNNSSQSSSKPSTNGNTSSGSSTTKPSTGSGSSSGSSTTKPSNGGSSSSGGTTNTGSTSGSGTGSTGGSSSSGSNTTKPTTPTEPEKPTHTHTWVEQTQVVHHEAVGHEEEYKELVSPAWTEEVPKYEYCERQICGNCNEDITDLGNAGISAHMKQHALNHEGKGYHSEMRYLQTGTETFTHEAVYETKTRWIVDQAAYDETVATGYKCSECGETK